MYEGNLLAIIKMIPANEKFSHVWCKEFQKENEFQYELNSKVFTANAFSPYFESSIIFNEFSMNLVKTSFVVAWQKSFTLSAADETIVWMPR